jgi:hypothetical protein
VKPPACAAWPNVMADDPRFASDLFAAADRHEIG